MGPVYYQVPSASMVRPSRAEDWEPYRDVISDIYAENTLAYTMEQMKAAHNFSATAKQYKTKIKEWGLDNKYIKDYEYERLLQLPTATEYTVRGRVVPYHDLMRYKRRKEKSHKDTADHGQAGPSGHAGESSGGADGNVYAGQYMDYSVAEGAAGFTTTAGDTVGYGGYVYDASGVVPGSYAAEPFPPGPGAFGDQAPWSF